MKAKIRDISITPVKKYAIPKYPTRTEVNSTPELLRKLPPRWQKNAVVVAAAGMLGAMTLTSCGLRPEGMPASSAITSECETEEMFILAGDPVPDVFTSEQDVTDETCELIDMLTTEEAKVAGELAGDVTMDIPSEQEFTEIIDEIETEEIIGAKSFFDTPNLPVAPGGIGPPIYISEADSAAIITGMTETYGLKLDELVLNNISRKFYDAEKQIGVEFSDYSEQESYVSSEGISVGVLNMTVYDECYKLWEECWEEIDKITYEKDSDEYNKKCDEINAETEIKVQELIKEDLREQVRDFIEWLQGQGII